MFLLDTDHVTLLFRGGSEGSRIQRRMLPLDPKDVGTTIVTYEEQSRGWLAVVSRAKSADEQIQAYGRLENHLDYFRRLSVHGFPPRRRLRFSAFANQSESARWTFESPRLPSRWMPQSYPVTARILKRSWDCGWKTGRNSG